MIPINECIGYDYTAYMDYMDLSRLSNKGC